jgi:hypothetical protein
MPFLTCHPYKKGFRVVPGPSHPGSAIDLVNAKTYTKQTKRVAVIPVIGENDDVPEMQQGEQGIPYQLCIDL